MLSQRLKESRKNRKLTQDELALKVNTTKSTISNYENGHSTPSNDMLVLLSNALQITTDYLLGRSNNPTLTEDDEFHAFANDPDMERWYRQLPDNDEDDLRKLRQMWDIIKSDSKNK
ncbi:transcriptional regulator [Sporosarcina sp. P20a]|uniref:helix-turn-helix domain-containing protein n=1 Tax=Sporosarcina sp. P20a TaxID=2048256 RepID=UPI000C166974|nr:helix-turn-helix transcriptional regulator [Sporosarcina sp. P20a]PIC87945.1 transcriptional regulator [Sporosarcina sp. P20a]